MFYKTLKTAIPYALELERKGIALSVPTNSHLKSLLHYSRLDNPENQIDSDKFVQSVENVTIMEGGATEHENFMATIVDELEPLVQSHVRIAKEVASLTKSFGESVLNFISSNPQSDASSEFNIVKDELGELFDEASVLGNIESGTHLINFTPTTLVTGPRDFETILSYLVTGRQNIDQALNSLIAQYDRSFLENIWRGMFNNIPGTENPYTPANLASLPSGERLAVAYITHCLASKIYSDVPDDANGSLSEFQRRCADLRDYALSISKIALAERHEQIRNNVVVLGYSRMTNTAIVNAPIYRDWLEKGGRTEVIFGCLLSDSNAFTAEQLDNSADRYINSWNGFVTFHNAESDVRRTRFLRSIYTVCFTEAMSEIQKFEENYRKENPEFAESAVDNAVAYLNTLGINELSDVSKVSLELMAGIRFNYTPAKFILQQMDQVFVSNPEADVREAALIAACAYIATSQATQITVNRK